MLSSSEIANQEQAWLEQLNTLTIPEEKTKADSYLALAYLVIDEPSRLIALLKHLTDRNVGASSHYYLCFDQFFHHRLSVGGVVS